MDEKDQESTNHEVDDQDTGTILDREANLWAAGNVSAPPGGISVTTHLWIIWMEIAIDQARAARGIRAEDLLWHDAGRSQLSGEYRGREAVFGLFGKLMEVTEGSFRADLHAVLADDEHAVALVVITASRGGRSIEVNEAHVFHMRDGKVVEFWNASTDMYAADELIG